MLYIVPTPIGNLGDITERAKQVLSSVDLILCEDTRNSSKLLSHLNIKKPLVSYHKFNEKKSVEKIITWLQEGKNLALISDCGTPLISDPGQVLVDELNKNNLAYTVLPGPCAFVTALVLSGFDCSKFAFFGFLPEKQKDRKQLLTSIKNLNTTLIFHISVHSIENDVNSFNEILGDRNACLVREISKIYEEKIYFNLNNLPKDLTQKGEFIIIIEGNSQKETIDNPEKEVQNLISQGLTKNQAIGKVAKQLNIDRNELYKKLIK